MGRELRRVPKRWEHPRRERRVKGATIFQDTYEPDPEGSFIPLKGGFDRDLESFKTDVSKMGWEEALRHHGGGPNPEDYVDYGGRPAEWYQVYETVSEGTPVTPAFETKDELIDYLVVHGDFWNQKAREEGDEAWGKPWSREAAENFVRESGWAPSMVFSAGRIMRGEEDLNRKGS